MWDLTIRLPNEPGALARMGEALGAAGVSVEGGGAWVVDQVATAHFLFADGAAARRALEARGIEVLADREVVTARLDQGTPGQLGRLARAMGDAGVNLEVVYSDHDHRLILVVDAPDRAREVAARWTRPGKAHPCDATVRWIGDDGVGTASYTAYRRDYSVEGAGRTPIPGSADRAFRGDPARWSPEQLLVAAVAACHQLSYLHCCADAGVTVVAYQDSAGGTLSVGPDGGGRITRVVLRPAVTIAPGSDPALARALHDAAASACFVARSVSFPVDHEPTVAVAP